MTRSASNRSVPLAWPLAGSVLLTSLVAAWVCTPPLHALHSWAQVVSLATMYLLVAACVHALAVWSVCRIREEGESSGWRLVLRVIWAAWVVVVWLPLLALLTSEHSAWIALILPVTAIFATLVVRRRSARVSFEESAYAAPRELFALEQAQPLWRMLLPAAAAALAVEGGCALLVAGHAWSAGCLFGAAAIYPLERWPRRKPARLMPAGNSLLVWVLLMLALTPFLATYTAGAIDSLFGLHAPVKAPLHRSSAQVRELGYASVILVVPRKPHEIVAPTPDQPTTVPGKPQVIEFDGEYFYYRQPATAPGPQAHIMRGDPVKSHIRSTDNMPLQMEAHQLLGRPLEMSCCRSLRVDVTNADTVAGPLAVEMLLRDTSSKAKAVSLGSVMLRSSMVSPMPLTRAPVNDSVSFALPHSVRGRSFNEITVRIRPKMDRALAGPKVAVRDFSLQP